MGTATPVLDLLTPHAAWTPDCGGKQDYDGEIISVSTRYWPASKSSDNRPSAHAAIHLNTGPVTVHWPGPRYDGGNYRVWREHHFTASTETRVKEMVEAWVTTQLHEIVALLGGIDAFAEPR